MKMNNINLIKNLPRDKKLRYYETYTDKISINNGNTKTGTNCLTLSVPASVCREDAPCKKGCYCQKGRQVFSQVLGGYMRNLRIWREKPDDFEKQLFKKLSNTDKKYFRWFDAGDIPDSDFFNLMIKTAKKFENISFLCYTKKYSIVNDYLNNHRSLPKNLTVRFSMWDKNWNVDNPHDLPLAFVNFKDTSKNPMLPNKAFTCRGGHGTTCDKCGVCFNKKVKNVIFNQH